MANELLFRHDAERSEEGADILPYCRKKFHWLEEERDDYYKD